MRAVRYTRRHDCNESLENISVDDSVQNKDAHKKAVDHTMMSNILTKDRDQPFSRKTVMKYFLN